MRTISYTARHAVCLSAAATMLAACSAAQPALNPAAPAQRSASIRAHRATSGDLLYVGGTHTVNVLTYPGFASQGTFKTQGAVSAICSDASGNVFVTQAPKKSSSDGTGYVDEYAHGGTTPIATLHVPSGEMPMSCASDPVSGNLAVTMQSNASYAPSVAIYAGASGTPNVVTSSVLGADPQCGYDGSGNLLVSSGDNVAAEIPAGKSSFKTITFNRTLGNARHLQWDGTYWALQAFNLRQHNGEKLWERVFRLQVSGSTAKVVGTVEFKNWPEKVSGSSWIDGDSILATPYSELVTWKYPDGGKITNKVQLSSHMAAVTVSVGG
ncbi:MAG TPA: hypothetical protein VN909_07605 [Candidatus Dormibacteraeota bacterium]|nr:hypothetical protein [Candidatus Dormibacteraeota bacterium]